MTAIDFIKNNDADFNLWTASNTTYSLTKWIDLMEQYAKHKHDSLVKNNVDKSNVIESSYCECKYITPIRSDAYICDDCSKIYRVKQ